MFPATPLILLLLSYAHVITSDSVLQARADCNTGYTTCSPNGAATTNEPPVGSALSTMYVDVVNSVSSKGKQARDLEDEFAVLQTRAAGGSLCCTDGTQCLLLQDYNLPFCYDNYTTNYYLPGGSYAQITSGNYTASDGSVANLISGNYSLADGTVGNIYGSPAAKPDTATLNLPTQYTASGSGSAIPATGLGEEVTYTTTIPGTTIPPSTVVGETIAPSVVGGSTASPGTIEEATTTISGAPTVAAETIAPSTVGGSTVSAGTTVTATTISATTVAPKTSTVVTRVAASATKKSAGSHVKSNGIEMLAVAGICLRMVYCI